jgi:hypothetical protein
MSLSRRFKRVHIHRTSAVIDGCAITYAPIHDPWFSRLPPSAKAAMPRIHQVMNGDPEPGDDTVRELERLIASHPDAPVFYKYLTVVLARRGEHARADEVTDEVLRRFPSYLFGRLSRAAKLLENGDDERAAALLGPTLELRDLCPERQQFHVSE